MKHPELIPEISRSFISPLPVPPFTNCVFEGKDCKECVELESILKDKLRERLTLDEMRKLKDGLSLYTKSAYRYFMPRYLEAVLQIGYYDFEEELIYSVVSALHPLPSSSMRDLPVPEGQLMAYRESRHAGFTKDEARTILKFLRTLRSDEDFVDLHERIDEAIRWWEERVG